MIKYVKGDMFKFAPKGELLVHACNAQGRWGSGIANTFACLYPMAYTKCKMFCHKNGKGRSIVGRGMIFTDEVENSIPVGCIFTSLHYGKRTDPPEMILEATRKSLKELIDKVSDKITIHSPKFNAGLFRVPWEDTKQILQQQIEQSSKDITWIVYEL